MSSDLKKRYFGPCEQCKQKPKARNRRWCRKCCHSAEATQAMLSRPGITDSQRSIYRACPDCGSLDTGWFGAPKCKTCWYRRRATQIEKIDLAAALEELMEEQEYRCYYTGEPLGLDDKTHIEHKTPRRRGGPTAIGNLCWSSENANLRKST